MCYYCVGIPIAYLAAFRLGLGAVGLWCGIAVAANLALPAYLIIVGCLRWENEAARAAQLVAEGEGEGRGNSEAAKGCGKIVSVGCVEVSVGRASAHSNGSSDGCRRSALLRACASGLASLP